ncbi:MAG TPA: thiolase family protein [Dehalococcoidia bacterium]|nr:thiolase family protein [Dehalococcoidia bacterium]
MAEMREAVVVDAVRTPFGRAGEKGVFRDITNVELVVPILKAIIERNKLDANLIDEIVMGSVGLAGPLTRARHYLFEADLPQTISGTDLNKQCGSSLQAFVQGAQAIMTGMSDVVLAGGVETMGRVGPVTPTEKGEGMVPGGLPGEGGAPKAELPPDWKEAELLPTWPKKVEPWIMNMGMTAEKLAKEYKVTREDSDKFALRSHQLTIKAQQEGFFSDQIVPITIKYKDGTSVTVTEDQGPRADTSLEKLATLKPAYVEGGQVTAGNACPRNDGASVVLIMEKNKARELGLKPLATFRHAATIGVDPTIMGIGPVPATRKLFQRTGLSIDQMDVIELNEAFACQAVAVQRELNAPDEKFNPHGGAVALGHPLGASGGRLVAQVARELNRTNGRLGLATLCMGGGMGMSVVLEREDYW